MILVALRYRSDPVSWSAARASSGAWDRQLISQPLRSPLERTSPRFQSSGLADEFAGSVVMLRLSSCPRSATNERCLRWGLPGTA